MTSMQLVEIEWVDSHGGDGWQSLDQIARHAKTVRCRSVGWLLSKAHGRKVIVPHLSGGDDDGTVPFGRGHLSIPDRAILKLRVLRKARHAR